MGVKPETCDDYKGILDAKLGIVLPAMEYEKLRFERERIMFNMACNVVDFDLIADRVIDCFNKVEENDAFCQKDPALRAQYYLMGTELYDQILIRIGIRGKPPILRHARPLCSIRAGQQMERWARLWVRCVWATYRQCLCLRA